MQTQAKIAVVGATGRVGRHIVDVLEAREQTVVEISRARGVDIISGAGLAEALTGVDCVIDAATGPSPDQQAATEFFLTATRNLQQVGARAGVRRIVVVSIIGIERFTGGYYMAKLAHERAMSAGPIPALILRAAQFHEFVEQLMAWGRRDDGISLPKMRTQLVAARTVAERLVDLALGARNDTLSEIAGPRPETLVDMARLLAARRGEPARIEAVSDPANPDSQAAETGALLPGPQATLAGPTFAQWLDATS